MNGKRRQPRLVARAANALRAARAQPSPHPSPQEVPDLTAMIGQIGTALLASSQATSDVEDTLNRIAGSYHRPDLRIFVLPTLVIVEDTRATPATTEIFPADQAALRLDQSDEIERLVRRIGSDQTDPVTVIATISEIRDRAPRFGVLLSILGHTLLTVGFGLVLNPTVTALPVYLVLGDR